MKAKDMVQSSVSISLAPHIFVEGQLILPDGADRLVLFAHGSGLFGPDSAHLANIFSRSGIGTLRFDLLTSSEAIFDRETQIPRHDPVTLGERMVAAVIWAKERRELQSLGLGIFGDDTGAAAALIAAVRLPQLVKAVVCRSGQLEAARSVFTQVIVPTLLITGDNDDSYDGNAEALNAFSGTKNLATISGVSNLLADSSRLDEAGELAVQWFMRHLQLDAPDTAAQLQDRLKV
jgi:predicted esterase